MRRRFGRSIWKHPGAGALAVCVAALALAGCSDTESTQVLPRGVSYVPIQESSQWMDLDPTSRERALAKGDFSLELISFTDGRQVPNANGPIAAEDISYNYDPDLILQGVKAQVPAMIQSYLPRPPHAPKAYKLEIELLRLRTYVRTGTLFTGEWGSYVTEVEVDARVRRADSTVVLQRHYRMNLHKRRSSTHGRGPTGERDRSEIFHLVDRSFRKIAENIGWEIRTGDDWEWKIEPVSPTVPFDPGITIKPSGARVSVQ